MSSDKPRVPHPHGEGSSIPEQIAQEGGSSQSQGNNSQPSTSQSSGAPGPSQMSTQEPVLPYDKPRQPTASEIFQENQRHITEQLVYPPVDPSRPLPPTKQKAAAPKSPKASHHKPVRLNHPPEDGSMHYQQELLEKETKEEAKETVKEPGPKKESRPSAAASAQKVTLEIAVPEPTPVAGPSGPSPKIPHNYEELDVIGNGAYGTVYKGRDLSDKGKLVALKKIRISLTEDGVPVNAVREIALLKNLDNFRHPNIVRLLDICHGKPDNDRKLSLVLVFEFIEMDLDHYLKKVPPPGLEPNKIKNLFHQLLNGVDFLHQNRVIHRDLKPQNILIDRYDRLKIADFGLARMYDYKMRLTTMVVTLWYRAPEVLLSNSYASPVDIWSCACIFAELFRKKPLFLGTNENEQLQRIFEVIGSPPDKDWPPHVPVCAKQFRGNVPRHLPDLVPEITSDACDLLQRMLKFLPDNRVSAYQCLKHPYFDSIRADAAKAVNLPGPGDPFGLGLAPMIVEDGSGPSTERLPGPSGINLNRSVSEPASNDENNPNSSNVTSSSQSAAAKHVPVTSASAVGGGDSVVEVTSTTPAGPRTSTSSESPTSEMAHSQSEGH